MIADPPLLDGAVHVRDTDVLPAVPATDVGAPGTVRGVTEAETVDVAPVPAALVALTRNVYGVPFVKPVTVAEAEVDVPSANTVYVVPSVDDSTT